MPLFRLAMLPLALLSVALPAAAQLPEASTPSTVTVTVIGQVQAPGQYTLPVRARIGDAIVASKPDVNAYILGAALLRPQDKVAQVKLKAGLAYDLDQLGKHRNPLVAATAARLSAWLKVQPVTGRVPGQQLEPRLLRLRPELNLPAENGDVVVFPSRPSHIRVLGAVQHDCELDLVPEQDAKTYLRTCPVNAIADRNALYVVQPDGVVQSLGVALWNRSSPQTLAPGAILYVPLDEASVRTIDPEFNRQFADFLATQLLPAPGASP